MKGDKKRGLDILQKTYDINDHTMLSLRAHLKIFIGDHEGAIKDFEILIDSSEPPRYFIANPIYVPLRNYPDYKRLLKKMNLY